MRAWMDNSTSESDGNFHKKPKKRKKRVVETKVRKNTHRTPKNPRATPNNRTSGSKEPQPEGHGGAGIIHNPIFEEEFSWESQLATLTR